MAKLHELLAVEQNLKNQANAARLDLQTTFDKKRHHFSRQIVTFKPYAENQPDVVQSQLDLQTTVLKEIDWLTPFLVKAIDAGHQVDIANTEAKADIILEDGTTLAEGVPATSLLQIDKRLKELQEFILQIPTLDPAKSFKADEGDMKGVYVAREISKERTQKMNRPLQLAPATDKHPAQVQLVQEDVPIGTLITQEWSGLITISQKGDYISRVEDLIRAVKKARSRANDTEADTVKTRIGAKLLKYVFG